MVHGSWLPEMLKTPTRNFLWNEPIMQRRKKQIGQWEKSHKIKRIRLCKRHEATHTYRFNRTRTGLGAKRKDLDMRLDTKNVLGLFSWSCGGSCKSQCQDYNMCSNKSDDGFKRLCYYLMVIMLVEVFRNVLTISTFILNKRNSIESKFWINNRFVKKAAKNGETRSLLSGMRQCDSSTDASCNKICIVKQIN